MPVQEQLRRRWALWRADAHYGRLFRQQLWQQRRARLGWAVRRVSVERRGRWDRRSVLLSRRATAVRHRGSDLWTATGGRVTAGTVALARGAAVGAGRVSAVSGRAMRGAAVGAGRVSAVSGRAMRGAAAGAAVGAGRASAVSGRAMRGLGAAGLRLGAAVWSSLGSVLRGVATWLRGRWTQLRSRPPSPRLAGAAALLLFSGVGGFAVVNSLDDVKIWGPSADETARPAADHSDGGRVPGLTRPGIFLSVDVTDAGALEVSEQARTGKSVMELSITPPPPLDGSHRLPRLEDVRVTADGRPVDAADTVEVTTVVLLDRPAKVIELRYRVVGASARSRPASPGRATLSLRPALATTLGGSRTMIEVRGTKVHTLVCVDLPRKRQLCGVSRNGGWRTQRLDTKASAVVALVDLPARTA